MEMISKAIVDGILQAKGEEPLKRHRETARALAYVGEHGIAPMNRKQLRAAKAKAKRKAGKARAERNRNSRGRVPA